MTVQAGQAAWIEEWPSRLTPLVDLLCFPGAGAGASAFRSWAGQTPPFAALLACQLPGRESRIDEAPVASLAAAAGEVVSCYAARRSAPRPLVLYGHSMGAVLAFETACRLIEMGRMPDALLVSASTPPEGIAHDGGMTPQAMKELLLAYDPENAAIISNDDLFAALAPVLHADIALLRGHRIDTGRTLPDVPVQLFSGAADPVVPPEAVQRWACHFGGPVSHETLPGGHHFPFRESRDAMLRHLVRMLRDAAGLRSGG